MISGRIDPLKLPIAGMVPGHLPCPAGFFPLYYLRISGTMVLPMVWDGCDRSVLMGEVWNGGFDLPDTRNIRQPGPGNSQVGAWLLGDLISEKCSPPEKLSFKKWNSGIFSLCRKTRGLSMTQRFPRFRSLVPAAILVLVISCMVVPVAAQNFSYIRVLSVPTGAMACLDHYTCNLTPTLFNTTPDSYHALSLYKAGYLSYTSNSVLSGPPEVITNLLITLAPVPAQTGALDIRSVPSGAEIWLDNLYDGTTPQVIGGLSAGIHTLLLRKPGYYDFTESFMVAAGGVTIKDLQLTPYPAPPGYGDIRVRSVPAGAAVYLNDNYMGSTISPTGLYITQLSPGSYTVRITLQDYQPYTVIATVTDGGIYDILANLVPVVPGPTPEIHGQLTIGSVPEGAGIYLDDVYRGVTPLTLVDIPAGSHSVLLRLDGYQDWQSLISVAAGSSTDVSGTLTPVPSPVPTSPPTTVITQPLPIQTRSPVSPLSIITAIGICGALVIANRKRE